jgi:hypothetical protein
MFQIEQEDTRLLPEKSRIGAVELLTATYYSLRNIPLRTRIDSEAKARQKSTTFIKIFEKRCSIFRISSQREYESRLSVYYPEKIISFTVGVPLLSRENQPSTRYSSYTKGYQESHPKKLQTPKDWEIDGEDIWDFEETQTLSLSPLILDSFDAEDESSEVLDDGYDQDHP